MLENQRFSDIKHSKPFRDTIDTVLTANYRIGIFSFTLLHDALLDLVVFSDQLSQNKGNPPYFNVVPLILFAN